MAKYGKKAGEQVEEAMHKFKRGRLKSGRSGQKAKSRKQAIAIGLSEAREKGAKVPSRGGSRRGGRTATRRRSTTRRGMSSRSRGPARSRTTGRFVSRRGGSSRSRSGGRTRSRSRS